MRNKACKLTVALLLLFCLAVPIFVGNMETEAADTTSIVEPYDVTVAKTYFDNDTAPDCKTDGYIFAGWYAETDKVDTDSVTGQEYFEGSPLTSLTGYTGTTVQALFVEQSVLGVKGQIAIIDGDDDVNVANVDEGATDAATANLRLVTSVDTKKYASVGFKVSYTYNNSPQSSESITNFVYPYLTYVDGEGKDETLLPYEVFSDRSKYFKACTLSGIPIDAFDMEVSVNTFWTTVDGAKVYGSEAVIKTVQEGVYHTYEAGVDETADGVTKTTYYKVLETAMDAVKADTKTVTLFKNAEVASDTEISGTVTITNLSGKDVTLYRASDLTSANMFSVASGGTLNIVGAEDKESIVLDGNKVSAIVAMVHSNGGTLLIKNATLQNVICTRANVGGTIFAQGATDLDVLNVKFIGNQAVNGGAIRAASTAEVFVSKCIFGELGNVNVATNDGGAIYTQSTDIEIIESQFLYNTATRFGGAICLNEKTSVLNVTNSKFEGNTTTGEQGRGGAIFQPGSSKVTLVAENDVDEYAVFENNSTSGENSGTTKYSGGAIYAGGASLTITGYRFVGNHSKYEGGAICAIYGTITIDGATFKDNYTTETGGYGGAVWISQKNASSLKNSVFTGNYTKGSAAHGGAIYLTANAVTGGSKVESSCSFSNNYVEADDAVNTLNSDYEGVYIAD